VGGSILNLTSPFACRRFKFDLFESVLSYLRVSFLFESVFLIWRCLSYLRVSFLFESVFLIWECLSYFLSESERFLSQCIYLTNTLTHTFKELLHLRSSLSITLSKREISLSVYFVWEVGLLTAAAEHKLAAAPHKLAAAPQDANLC